MHEIEVQTTFSDGGHPAEQSHKAATWPFHKTGSSLTGSEDESSASDGLEASAIGGWWGESLEREKTELSQRSPNRTTTLQKGILSPLRQLASGHRHRYQLDGFDLDLAYVTTRIIAMGFPSSGTGKLYRNPATEVRRFLDLKHFQHYRIYNLCSEQCHQNNGFPEQSVSFPFADHSPPALPFALRFCEDVQDWLKRDELNVAAVHCKAGKGRSGTMICALLLYAGVVSRPQDAVTWFARVRGGRRSGVTIPSQLRYVAMFAQWLKEGTGPESDPMGSSRALRLRLREVAAGPLAAGVVSQDSVWATVRLATRSDESGFRWMHTYPEVPVTIDQEGVARFRLPETGPMWAEHDGLLQLRLRRPRGFCSTLSFKSPALRMSCWWHQSFLERAKPGSELQLVLPKAGVDGLQRDTKHSKVPESFSLSITFDEMKP